ncbi:MAG: AmmeMemoRadiSam system radical SAM enzyme [Candidatus Micrarchaeia archaeon]
MEKPALLYEKLDGGKVRCKLCARYCTIARGRKGFCLVRKNKGGKLFTESYGKSTGLQLDPIEKKPFYHFKPNTQVLSFGTPGCNFRCLNCQNWDLSQGLQDGVDFDALPFTSAESIAKTAVECKADGVAYTYSEPTIFFEYACDTVFETRKISSDKFHVFVSNGYFSKEMFELVQKERLFNAIRIDLKFVEDDKYLQVCSGSLKPVKESIERVYAAKKTSRPVHLELIALVIPSLNDSPDQLQRLAKFVASIGKDIPIHFIRFFPHYKMQSVPMTSDDTLLQAKKIAEAEGLEYVFVGNTSLKGSEDTRCPKCREILVKRRAMSVSENKLQKRGGKVVCFKCGEEINLVL